MTSTSSTAGSAVQFKTLDEAQALDHGSNLWITFAPEDSAWTRRLDWYLNFALAKWERHHPQRQSDALKVLIQEEELELPDSKLRPRHPVLISSFETFPNREIVILTKNSGGMSAIPELVTNLNAHAVRIFLPDGVTAEKGERELEKLEWPSPDRDGSETEASAMAIEIALVGAQA